MKKIIMGVLVGIALLNVGCAVTVSPDATTAASGIEGSCETTVDATAALTNQALCTPTSGTGKHFRVESVDGTAATMGNSTTTSRYYQIGIGYEAGKTSSFTSSTTAGDGKFYIAGGRHIPIASDVITWFDFGGQSTQNETNVKYANYFSAAQTICFDISASAPPKITIWVDGTNGANCKVRLTLTAANAVVTKSDWTSTAAANFTGSNYIRITGSAAPRLSITKVVVFPTTAL